MAEERKEYLKEQIISKIEEILDNHDISLEELEDGLSILIDSIKMDDLTSLKEN